MQEKSNRCPCGCGKYVAAVPVSERFWAYVLKEDGCWKWTGPTSYSGYGYLKISNRSVRAHRLAWEIANGPIMGGLHVLHHCDNRLCVRVDHLFLGTHTKRGSRQPWAITNEAQVREIRLAHNKGISLISLSRLTGLTLGTICAIVSRRRWSHVE